MPFGPGYARDSGVRVVGGNETDKVGAKANRETNKVGHQSVSQKE